MRWHIALLRPAILTALTVLAAANVGHSETVSFSVDEVKRITDGSGAVRILLSFKSLESLAGSKILYAKLYLDFDRDTCTGKLNELMVYPITKEWSASTATWSSPWDSSGGNLGADCVTTAPFSNGASGLTEVHITEFVQAWVNGSIENHGLALVPIEEGCDYQIEDNNSFPGSGYGKILIRYMKGEF